MTGMIWIVALLVAAVPFALGYVIIHKALKSNNVLLKLGCCFLPLACITVVFYMPVMLIILPVMLSGAILLWIAQAKCVQYILNMPKQPWRLWIYNITSPVWVIAINGVKGGGDWNTKNEWGFLVYIIGASWVVYTLYQKQNRTTQENNTLY